MGWSGVEHHPRITKRSKRFELVLFRLGVGEEDGGKRKRRGSHRGLFLHRHFSWYRLRHSLGQAGGASPAARPSAERVAVCPAVQQLEFTTRSLCSSAAHQHQQAKKSSKLFRLLEIVYLRALSEQM